VIYRDTPLDAVKHTQRHEASELYRQTCSDTGCIETAVSLKCRGGLGGGGGEGVGRQSFGSKQREPPLTSPTDPQAPPHALEE
jgi:hypothetical protein